MAIQFLNPQLGPGETHDPKERLDWSGISDLAKLAKKAESIREERRTLRQIMRMGGRDIPEPEREAGFMGGLKRVFGMGQESKPISELERTMGEAMVKSQFPTGADKYYNMLAKASEEGLEAPEGYEYGYNAQGKRVLQKTPKPTETKVWRDDLNKWRRKEISMDSLIDLYPDKEAKIRDLSEKLKPLGIEPLRQAKNIFQRAKKGFAKLDPQTAAYAKGIRTKGDLQKLIDEEPLLKARGINTQGLLDYYTELDLFE